MKLKEKFQRFWTLSKSHEGFTLVELIVVIAILAILAGVAIPVYNGYIKKAQTAADQTLLDSVNTSYAAALAENGYSYLEVADATLVVSDGAVSAVTDVILVDGTTDVTDKVGPSFEFYFKGNEESKFSFFKSFDYDSYNGMFVGSETEGRVAINYGGITLYVPQAYVDALNNSGFMNYAGLGTATLVGKLDSVTTLAGALVGEDKTGNAATLMNSVFDDPDFLKYMGDALGADLSTEEGQKELGDLLISQGVTEEQLKANAAVLYASKNAASMDQDAVVTLLASGNAKQSILDNMKAGNTTEALSQAALAYGMYTSFAHSSYGSEAAQGKDEIGAMNDLNNEKFIEYMNSPDGKADLEGYIAALNMVNSSADSSEAVSKLLVNGFADQDLLDAINGALGNG